MNATPAIVETAADIQHNRLGRRRLMLGAGIAVGGALISATLILRGTNRTPQQTASGRRRACHLTARSHRPSTTRALAALRDRPVVINLFAAWCHPCRSEFPVLQTASVATLAFLGIDHQDSRRAAPEMLRENAATYPAAQDPHGTSATAYRSRGCPPPSSSPATGPFPPPPRRTHPPPA